MDFQLVLGRLLDGFESRKTRYALIGGFALGALGAARATKNIDFLVHRDDLKGINELLEELGYRRIHYTDNVFQYQHDSQEWGGMDFLHAFRPHALRILERALPKPVFQGARFIRVARPEGVIGLKIQSMAGNPLRRNLEAADIEMLAEIYGNELNWDEVKEYYELFGLHQDFVELRERFGHA
jgi:hypothetical protein